MAADPPADWTVYVVDSHSLIFQVFHAIPEMTSPRGEPVNAVFGFTKDLLKLLEEKRPDALICAFDPPGDTFRHDFYPAYKGERGEMPEALRSQFPKIEAVVRALGLPIISVPKYEADDVLATLARLCDEAGATCRLVTGDKDCRQLITDRVAIYNLRKDQVYDQVALQADWGVRPDQVVDFQALIGDKIDNVPGVPLIGPKIAKELLEEYDTLLGVLNNAERVKGAKRKQNLLEGRDLALVSQRLVRLDNHTPFDVDWQAWRVAEPDAPRLAELMADFGFRSLAERAAKLAGGAVDSPQTDWVSDYHIVDTPERLAELVQQLSGCEIISVDTETTSVSPREAELVGLSLAWAEGKACYVPVRGPSGERVLPVDQVLSALGPVLENPAIEKLGQNLKYDAVVLRGAGVILRGLRFDTMIASYLLDAGERTHNLDVLAERYLGHQTVKIKELIGTGKTQKRMDEVPVAKVGHYAAEDADVPLRLWPLLADRLDAVGLLPLMDEIETPLVDVLAQMEWNGVRVDIDRLAKLSEQFGKRLQELAEEIEELVGHPFNLASPKQLAEVLFQELRLPIIKRTKTGPSTDASVLEQLALQHPLPRLIVEHRQYAKLRGTYVDALPALVLPSTARVHCSFNQVVAATGRLSCSDPNLQNIPIRTEEGRQIRSAFVAGPNAAESADWKLLSADYSQIELRVLAHFSRDETLCQAFAADQDIHTLVASQVNGVPLGDVTSEQRRGAKAVNFGIIYGQSAFGLAKSLGIPQDVAASFIAEYFARYPGVADFMLDTLESCQQLGYVETLMGRRRAISGVRKPAPPAGSLFDDRPQPLQMNLPERTAVNTVIQGTAADLIKLAMLAVHRRMQREGLRAKLILQIHDELVFDTPIDELPALETLVREEMQNVADLRVPLSVDIGVGDNWAEC
ncbi:DNA polymerase I [Botrimarina hoheduenensis]|uniref:DNA polymerase I n=1 Tax=Botrimarina hoheduenensis TaxID=2528000 RepID=A0A5C5WFC3_9BACT|nr:DNA polymerase I [Botrimarina hoheduenensis]TWT48811.1 DNA polymerase I [Botrimarina hoheduenensis]